MFYLISLGLENDDVTAKAIKAMKECRTLYFEGYTSIGVDIERLSRLLDKNIIKVEREFIERKSDFILDEARKKNVGLLVQGDCLSATTHISLLMDCIKKKIPYNVVHGVSVLTAVGGTGLSLYNFGKTASIPFERNNLKVPYGILKENLSKGMHTLFLLDLDPKNNKFLSIPEALEYLLGKGMDNRMCVGCCGLGSENQIVKYGRAKELLKEQFKTYPQCLIIPGKMHFMEEEFLNKFRI